MNNNELTFYLDTLIVEAALLDDQLIKNAGILSTIKDGIVSYFNNHMNPDDKIGSVLNFLAPGAISVLIGGWLGPTFGLAMRVLNVDVAGILRTLYDSIKNMLQSGQPINSNQIDDLVTSTIQVSTGEVIEKNSFYNDLKYARFLKLATIDLHHSRISEENLKNLFASNRRSKSIGILAKLLSWIFKVALSSAGLMVAGDAVNKLLGRPNAFDNTIQNGKEIENSKPPVIRQPQQTKFKIKPSYNNIQYNKSQSWIEQYPNTKSGVESMLISFVKEVYEGLDNSDNVIRSVPGFKTTVDEILWFNHSSVGDPVIFLPKYFISKKQLVDHFIDEIAAKSN